MSEDNLSAQVILNPAGEAGGQPATSETVADLLPPPASVELARSFFSSRGFDVAPAFGSSFSITGPVAVYDATFGPRGGPKSRERAVDDGADDSDELSLDQLPEDVAGAIKAVVFPPPPDFGPARF